MKRNFWNVKESEVDREHEFDYESIVGCKDLHSIRSIGAMDVNKLLKRSLACFCLAFIDWD